MKNEEDRGGPAGVNDGAEEGGGPAGVVERLKLKAVAVVLVANPLGVCIRLSGVDGGLEEKGTVKPDIWELFKLGTQTASEEPKVAPTS